jgi:hypothetical protein
MKTFFVIAGLALCALNIPSHAAEGLFGHSLSPWKTSQLDAKEKQSEEGNNACADAFSVIAADVAEKQLPSWIRKCNANADRNICRETRSMLEKVGKKSTEFSCGVN